MFIWMRCVRIEKLINLAEQWVLRGRTLVWDLHRSSLVKCYALQNKKDPPVWKLDTQERQKRRSSREEKTQLEVTGRT